jgi:hypothetical protein
MEKGTTFKGRFDTAEALGKAWEKCADVNPEVQTTIDANKAKIKKAMGGGDKDSK